MKKLEIFVPDPLFPFVGRYRDIVGVMRKGELYYRRVGKMDKERVTTDPKFANSGLARREFGLGSTLSATIRKPLLPALEGITDRWMHSRLSGAINSSFNKLEGTRGKRRVSLAETLKCLEKFRFNKDRDLLSRYGNFRIDSQPVVDKPIIKYQHKSGLHGKYKYPGYATHIRAKLILTAISDMKPDNLRKKKPKYLPIDPLHGQSKTVYGPWIPINALHHPNTQRTIEWHPDREYPEAIEAGCTIVATIAIEVADYNPETGEENCNRPIAAQIIHAQKIEQNIIEKRTKTAKNKTKSTTPATQKITETPQNEPITANTPEYHRETIRQTWHEPDPAHKERTHTTERRDSAEGDISAQQGGGGIRRGEFPSKSMQMASPAGAKSTNIGQRPMQHDKQITQCIPP